MSATPTLTRTGVGSGDLCAPSSRKFILVAAILASSLGFIDGSMVSIALPAMRESLGANLVQAQWISNAYLLTLSALMLAGGAAGDRFGLARVFASGIVLFVAASIACALAPNAPILIIARGIQGIGAALMVPGSLALISRAYPEGDRGWAIGIWAAAAAVTSALGPIIGGLSLTFGGPETWRFIFAINLPLGGLALYFLATSITQDAPKSDKSVDWFGACLAVLALGLFALSLTGAEHGELIDRRAMGLSVCAIGLFLCFLYVESRAENPMMPLHVFKKRGFSAANLISFLIYFGFSAILFYLPMLVIGAWGVTEIETSAAFAPLSVFIATLSGVAGRLADRVGPGPLLAVGSFVLALGYAGLAIVVETENFWGAVMPAMCLQGIGMGLIVAPLSTAIMNSVSTDTSGTASGINNSVTRMASLIAIAAMGSFVSVTYGGNSGPLSFGAIDPLDEVHRMASELAFRRVAWIASALAFVGVIVATTMVPKATTPPSGPGAQAAF